MRTGLGIFTPGRRRQGRVEALVNGDFAAGAANWNVTGADATHIVTFAGGTCRYQSDVTTPVLTVQQVPLGKLKVGSVYDLTVVCSAYTSGAIKTDNIGSLGLIIAAGLGTFTFRGVALGTDFSFYRNTASVDLTIDSISLQEVLV